MIDIVDKGDPDCKGPAYSEEVDGRLVVKCSSCALQWSTERR